MADEGDKDADAFKWTAITFGICFGLVLLTLLIEYFFGGDKSIFSKKKKSIHQVVLAWRRIGDHLSLQL